MQKATLISVLMMMFLLTACSNSKSTEQAMSNKVVAAEKIITEEAEARETQEIQEIEITEIVREEAVDTEPPVISGVQEITVCIGDSISYKKGIKVTDNRDKDVTLKVDKSKVNPKEIGVYPVYYSAKDAAGNEADAETVIHIVAQPEINEANILPLADAIIAEVTTPEMSDWDKTYALWNWCRTKIRYAPTAGNRESIWTGAYEGLHNRYGDCYAYYATFTVFLNRIGVENICVTRINGTSNHWWSLVNLGEGWYHCDSSPRKAGHKYKCFMQTDAQVQAYTDFYVEHPNYYVFDTTLYPERGTEVVFDGGM